MSIKIRVHLKNPYKNAYIGLESKNYTLPKVDFNMQTRDEI